MNLAVIGTGNVGSTLGRRWAQQGHQVTFGSRRPDAEDVQQLVQDAGPNAHAATPDGAAAQAEVVVLATPWKAAEQAVRSLGDLRGKILVDCVNPVGPGFTFAEGSDPSAAERIAGWAAGARVVKAFSTTGAKNMADPVYDGQPLAMFICGDDAEAKATVADLAAELGFEPVDNGPLSRARLLEALALVWISYAYGEGHGPDFGFALLRR